MIIGKQGANLKAFQDDSGAVIKLSPSGHFYPGTDKRVLVVSSNDAIEVLITAMRAIMAKIAEVSRLCSFFVDTHINYVHIQTLVTPGHSSVPELKLAIPNAAAGVVIGKGGENIKAIAGKSEAKITLVPRDTMPPG